MKRENFAFRGNDKKNLGFLKENYFIFIHVLYSKDFK